LSKSEEPKKSKNDYLSSGHRSNLGNQSGYDPEIGLALHVDYICNLRKSTYDQVKLVYAIFQNDKMLVGNRQMGPVLISPDTYAVTQNKAVFGTRHVVKNIKADQSIKLVIEIQADQAPNKFLALSWTMVNLFKMIDCNLQKGMIKLPLFQQPTDPYIPVHQISSNCAPDSSFL